MNLRTCSMVFVATIACGHVSAGVISLDLLDPAGVGGTAGEAFEARNPFTISDVTFSAAAVTSLGSMTGAYSANASTAGLNSVGVLDSPSEMDVGEVLTFTLTFDDAALAVKLLSIDFSGIGSTSDDSALATTSAGMFTLFTGQPDFNGSTDVWSPDGITYLTGDTISVQASGVANEVALQAMSFNVTTISVPEATIFPALVFLTVCGAGLQRRRQSAVRRVALAPDGLTT